MIPSDARMLRLYLTAADRWQGRPLYRVIVEAARTANLAGTTVYAVDLSLGAQHHMHDITREYDACEMPVIVEIIESRERIEAFLSDLEPMIPKGLATVEPVRVLRYVDHVEPRS